MRIEIGTRGKIVGTKRVDESGRISGLSNLAGEDVFVLAPEGIPVLRPSLRDRIEMAAEVARTNLPKYWKRIETHPLRNRLQLPKVSLGELAPKPLERRARAALSRARTLPNRLLKDGALRARRATKSRRRK